MTRASFVRIAAVFLLAACGGAAHSDGTPAGNGQVRQVRLGAYSTPREAYGQAVLPAFAKKWKEEHGEDVKFQESYQGSGAQARAVIDGFEADIVALSLEPDVEKIVHAGLVTHDWRATPTHGMVTTSYVVIAIRPGNPKGIHDWADLARPDVQLLTPNVRTSGGAMWNIAAIYGAALRGHIAGVAPNDPAAAQAFLAKVLHNVPVMDKGARESMLTFESGVGDAAITYENEVVVAKNAGEKVDYVAPSSTLLVENPIAVVDSYAVKHGNADIAQAFVDFATGPEAQAAFAKYGLRSGGGDASAGLANVTDAFAIADLGGWGEVQKTIFEKDGPYDRALASSQGGAEASAAKGTR
jgi:sulfate transport system substrate-binding protein